MAADKGNTDKVNNGISDNEQIMIMLMLQIRFARK